MVLLILFLAFLLPIATIVLYRRKSKPSPLFTGITVCAFVLLVLEAGVVLIFFPAIVMSFTIESHKAQIFYFTDHDALLKDARGLIESKKGIVAKTGSCRVQGDEVPKTIAALGPLDVEVYPSSVSIQLGGGFHHYGLMAYTEGVEGSGDRKLIDGLWFCEEH